MFSTKPDRSGVAPVESNAMWLLWYTASASAGATVSPALSTAAATTATIRFLIGPSFSYRRKPPDAATDQEPTGAMKARPRAATIPPRRGANKPRRGLVHRGRVAGGSCTRHPQITVSPSTHRALVAHQGPRRPTRGVLADYHHLSMRYCGGDDVEDVPGDLG